jgi:hypothetical protein
MVRWYLVVADLPSETSNATLLLAVRRYDMLTPVYDLVNIPYTLASMN